MHPESLSRRSLHRGMRDAGMPREDIDDFLQAVHAIRTMEHASDLAEHEGQANSAAMTALFSEVFGIVEGCAQS